MSDSYQEYRNYDRNNKLPTNIQNMDFLSTSSVRFFSFTESIEDRIDLLYVIFVSMITNIYPLEVTDLKETKLLKYWFDTKFLRVRIS